ncbi:plasmid mobilization protein [Mesorhizobium sp. ASY16-5R]|uniref:plasmid mobilization protein n=1 Tax=Mesorhizobium sp. ASY16-5R TaxID=3445772 RepID=UPI003FA0EC20
MRFEAPMVDQIRVRVARDEKRRLAEFARQRGMTLSDLLRIAAANAAQQAAA